MQKILAVSGLELSGTWEGITRRTNNKLQRNGINKNIRNLYRGI
jgi:hypothetical protein